jgi:uncharacterized protein (DUF2235 family)
VRSQARDGTDQVVYYHAGLGTSGGLDKFTGGAFGDGIEENIRELYRFLIYNYVAGDEIYLFGFSRGAFTVRTLAGFLSLTGLLQKDDDYYVPEVYACYENGLLPNSTEWKQAFHNIQGTQVAPPIHMIGVWDTVGALGAPGMLGQMLNGKKYQYHNIGLTPQIQHAVHAMAIDEQRKPFAVNLWQRPAGWAGSLEQVWFPGVHCNVGGGYRPDGLANEALHWMIERAEALGLEFDADYLQAFRPCFNSILHDSMSAAYRVMGPILRDVGQNASHGEALHQSVLDRIAHAPSKYAPANVSTIVSSRLPIVTTTRIARGTPC